MSLWKYSDLNSVWSMDHLEHFGFKKSMTSRDFLMTSSDTMWHHVASYDDVRHHELKLSMKGHVTWYEPIKTLWNKMKNVATSTLLSVGVQYLSTCHPMGMEIEPVSFEDLGLILKMAFTANQNHSEWFMISTQYLNWFL